MRDTGVRRPRMQDRDCDEMHNSEHTWCKERRLRLWNNWAYSRLTSVNSLSGHGRVAIVDSSNCLSVSLVPIVFFTCSRQRTAVSVVVRPARRKTQTSTIGAHRKSIWHRFCVMLDNTWPVSMWSGTVCFLHHIESSVKNVATPWRLLKKIANRTVRAHSFMQGNCRFTPHRYFALLWCGWLSVMA